MSEIVVGYDGSDCAKAALQESLELAKDLGDSVVLVFGAAPGGYGGGEVPTQRDAVMEYAEKVTKEGVATAEAAKIGCEVEILNHHPVDALTDTAEKRKARMIVVGTHGDSPLKGAIIGSTPHKLVQLSKTPVLV